MVQVSYPGVYVQEVPSGVRPISPVSTSVGAFVGFFVRGPMNKAVEIFGMGDFERIFGGLHASSEASYAISQFFLNGGVRAYVVRIAAPTSSSGGDSLAKASVALKDTPAGTSQVALVAINEGAWGNQVRVRVDWVDASTFHLYVSTPTGQEAYLNLSMTGTRAIDRVINAGSESVRASTPAAGAAPPAATGTLGTPVSPSLSAATVPLEVTYTAGTTSLVRTIDVATSSDARELRNALEQALRTVDVSSAAGRDPVFTHANVTLLRDPDPATGADRWRFLVRAGRRSPSYAPDGILTFANGSSGSLADDLGLSGASANVQEYALGGASIAAQVAGDTGGDGGSPTATEFLGNPGLKTGLHALRDADLFNLLALPDVSGFIGTTELTNANFTAVIDAAKALCDELRSFLLVDIPSHVRDVRVMRDWLADNPNVRDKNVAVYFPRLMIGDPLDEFRPRSFGASGTLAGVMSRVDAQVGVWKAPAGIDTPVLGVSALDNVITDLEHGSLNPKGINCLRNFPIYGRVVWGARTTMGSDEEGSEWKYVPVRRLALMIEESLFRGTKWVVFQPNDESLWSRIRLNVGAFMTNLHRRGAFQGKDPADAFYVRCDGQTTPAADRNRGIVNIEVGFAPLKPAEFVVIRIQQIPDVQ